MPETQLAWPFILDEQKLRTFLTRYESFEEEEDRLREEKRLLKEDFSQAIPMRAVLAALKIVRTRRKLAAHPKEPMPPQHLALLEAFVEQHLVQRQVEMQALLQEAVAMSTGTMVQRPG